MARQKFNIIVFRKVLRNSVNEMEGFEMVFCLKWRGVSNLQNALLRLDRDYPDWWYINVYNYLGGEYRGRIYTDSRLYQSFQ